MAYTPLDAWMCQILRSCATAPNNTVRLKPWNSGENAKPHDEDWRGFGRLFEIHENWTRCENFQQFDVCDGISVRKSVRAAASISIQETQDCIVNAVSLSISLSFYPSLILAEELKEAKTKSRKAITCIARGHQNGGDAWCSSSIWFSFVLNGRIMLNRLMLRNSQNLI